MKMKHFIILIKENKQNNYYRNMNMIFLSYKKGYKKIFRDFRYYNYVKIINWHFYNKYLHLKEKTPVIQIK